MFSTQKIQKFGSIRKPRDIEGYAVRHLLLEICLSREQPDRQHEDEQNVLLQKKKNPLPQQIGRNQSSVQIDCKRHILVVLPPRVHF